MRLTACLANSNLSRSDRGARQPGEITLTAIFALLLLCGAACQAGEIGTVTAISGKRVDIRLHNPNEIEVSSLVTIARYGRKFVHPVTGGIREEQIEIIAHGRIENIRGGIGKVELSESVGTGIRTNDAVVADTLGKLGERLWVGPRGETKLHERFNGDLQNWSRRVGSWRIAKGKLHAEINPDKGYAQIMSKTQFGTNNSVSFDLRVWKLGEKARIVFNLHDPRTKQDQYFFRIDEAGVKAVKIQKDSDGKPGAVLIASNDNFQLEPKRTYTVTLRREIWHLGLDIDGVQMISYLDTDHAQRGTKLGFYAFDCKSKFDNVKIIQFPKVAALPSNELLAEAGKIIHVDGNSLWANLKSDDVEAGDKFPVARQTDVIRSKRNEILFICYEKVGEIEVMEPGTEVSHARLTDGDRVTIGDVVFRERPSNRIRAWQRPPPTTN